MDETWTKVSDAPLFHEHLLLGATFGEDDALLAAPLHYGDAKGESDSLSERCGLCDLSGMTVVLVSGEQATAFVSAACANEPLAVGECRFGAVVTGDGSVAAVPLVARTGDAEYLLVDPTEHGLALLPWLGFLAGIEQQGFRPFEGVSVEDVSASLHPLLLGGPQATSVLADYVRSPHDLPERGRVTSVNLDRIPCLVLSPRMGSDPLYLLLVPPASARILWRSFLSFPVVDPLGTEALVAWGTDALAWLTSLVGEDGPSFDHAQLLRHDLVRLSGGYVGERALRESPKR